MIEKDECQKRSHFQLRSCVFAPKQEQFKENSFAFKLEFIKIHRTHPACRCFGGLSWIFPGWCRFSYAWRHRKNTGPWSHGAQNVLILLSWIWCQLYNFWSFFMFQHTIPSVISHCKKVAFLGAKMSLLALFAKLFWTGNKYNVDLTLDCNKFRDLASIVFRIYCIRIKMSFFPWNLLIIVILCIHMFIYCTSGEHVLRE